MSVSIENIEKITSIVRTNFNDSVERYESFEEDVGLFTRLTERLVQASGLVGGSGTRSELTLMDMGCGTGISTFVLAVHVGEKGRVIGIDISEGMLQEAVKKLEEWNDERKVDEWNEERKVDEWNTENSTGNIHPPSIEFRCGDAANLTECVREQADGVFFNASIFLFPDPLRAIQSAHRSLRLGGIVAMNHLIGIYCSPGDQGRGGDGGENEEGVGGGEGEGKGEGEREGEGDDLDVFQSARDRQLECAPYGRAIMDVDTLPGIMEEAGFKDIRQGTISLSMTREEVYRFYSIPAQSAGLYPRTPYKERLHLLESLLDHFEKGGIGNFQQRWGWIVGVK